MKTTAHTIPSLRISTAAGCNHRCSFCQIEGDFASTVPVASSWRDPMEQSVLNFWRLGVRHYSLTGGEPLVNPTETEYFADLVRAQFGPVPTQDGYLRLNTNGVFVTRHLPLIQRSFDLVKISLHSLNQTVYASITGSKSPQKDLELTLQGISELDRLGVPMRIQMVVTPENANEVWNMINFCSRFRSIKAVKLFDISEYSTLWRNEAPGREYWQENYRSLEKLEHELRTRLDSVFVETAQSIGGYGNPMPIFRLGNLEVRLRRSDTGAHFGPHCRSCPAWKFCSDGHCNLEIGPNLRIKVCRPLEGPTFCVGDEKEALKLFFTALYDPRPDLALERY